MWYTRARVDRVNLRLTLEGALIHCRQARLLRDASSTVSDVDAVISSMALGTSRRWLTRAHSFSGIGSPRTFLGSSTDLSCLREAGGNHCALQAWIVGDLRHRSRIEPAVSFRKLAIATKAGRCSSARPEQFVEEVAEPRLEHPQLGLRDRNALRPILR
jgi:hypothetical protein